MPGAESVDRLGLKKTGADDPEGGGGGDANVGGEAGDGGGVGITSDAERTFNDSGEWFQFLWPAEWEGVHKELLPILAACAVWGHLWQGCKVRCLCDNTAVVAIVRSGS